MITGAASIGVIFFTYGGFLVGLKAAAVGKAVSVGVASVGGLVLSVGEVEASVRERDVAYASVYGESISCVSPQEADERMKASLFLLALDICGMFDSVRAWRTVQKLKQLPTASQELIERMGKDGIRLLESKGVDEVESVLHELQRGGELGMSSKNSVGTTMKVNGYKPELAIKIIENNNGFKRVEGKTQWIYEDKIIEFKENTWVYRQGSGVEIQEWTICERYGVKIKTTTTGTKSFMQKHHGIQNIWGEKKLAKYGYKSDNTPAILLRDSCSDTPHQYITANQKKRERDILSRNYLEERKLVEKELKTIGVPEERIKDYLLEADKYFKKIYEKVPEKERMALFGKEICEIWGK